MSAIVVDTSALVAISAGEPDQAEFLAALADTDQAWLSSFTYVELGVVLILRGYLAGRRELDAWLSALGVEVLPDIDLSASALEAYLRYGKGVHPAALNLSDCFAYALAKKLDAPLLYKGNDFARTDIRAAVQPT